MAAITSIIIGGAAVAGGAVASHEAGAQREGKLDEAREDTQEDLAATQTEISETVDDAQLAIRQARGGAMNKLRKYEERTEDALTEGLEDSRGDRLGALEVMTRGAESAEDDIRTGTRIASRPLQDLASTRAVRTRDVTGQRSRTGEMFDRGLGPVDLEADPGYQFRRQQGEEALARKFAAQGGRSGGRAMKALAGFNQDLASQEYAAAHGRQLQDFQSMLGAGASADQLQQAGLFNQAGRELQAGMGAQNLQAMGQQGLANLYASQGTQLAGINMQQGQAGMQQFNLAAQDQLYTASQLAQMFAQSGQNQANLMMNAAGMDLAATQAQINAQLGIGTAYAQANQIGADQGGAGLTNLTNFGMAVGNMGMNAVGTGAGLAGASLSDADAKHNVRDASTEIEEMMGSLEPVRFEYIGQPREHFGIIAQDAERTRAGRAMVIKHGGMRLIDIRSAQLMTLAAVANLHKRIRALEGGGNGE